MRSHFQGFLKFRVVAAVGEQKGSFFDFVETVTSRSKSKPLSYETVRRAFFNQLLALKETETNIDVALHIRDVERDNVVHLLALFTEKALAGKFDLSKGIAKLEERLANDPSIRDDHLRAYRLCRQPALLVTVAELKQAIRQVLTLRNRYEDARWPNDGRVLWAEMKADDWKAVEKMLDVILAHKVWIERNPAHAVTLQDNRKGAWEEILLTGRLPGAPSPVYAPLDSGALLRAVS